MFVPPTVLELDISLMHGFRAESSLITSPRPSRSGVKMMGLPKHLIRLVTLLYCWPTISYFDAGVCGPACRSFLRQSFCLYVDH